MNLRNRKYILNDELKLTNFPDKDLVNAGDKVGYDVLIDKLTKVQAIRS